MEKVMKILYRDELPVDFPSESTLFEISKHYQKYYNYPILIGKVDNDITNLQLVVDKKSEVDFYDRSTPIGNLVYSSSLQFILIVAIKRLFGKNVNVLIEHSIDRGIYCELIGRRLDENVLKKIYDEMMKIVAEDLLFTKISVSRMDAIKYFKKENKMDKVNVLKYTSSTYVSLYRLDNVYDFFFTELTYSTKLIDSFRLTYIKDNGFVMSLPDTFNPECTLEYKHYAKVFNKFLDYTKWGRTIGITNASDLNEIVSNGNYNDAIRLAEANFESQLSDVSNTIYENRKHVKLVLLAGPSSSGKTTTSKKLAVYLQTRGFITHSISVDDYFKDRDKTPKLPNGEYDFESINAIDLDLFNKQLTKLLDGERVLLPQYNFVSGKKEFKKKWLEIKEKDIIIIEGLHALNDNLTIAIDRKQKFKIYISPLTQVNIDDHNRIHTSDTRRLRRIIRDNKFRGHSASATLSMWKGIREGEERYIYPFQNDADMVINTALIYEFGVLKVYAEPLLFSVSGDDPNYTEAFRLINLLKNFLPIPSDEVPKDSIIREFIGGSGFKDE